MPRILNPRKALLTQSGDNLPLALRGSLYGIAAQTLGPSSTGTLERALPIGGGKGDQTTQVAQDGTFTFTVYDGNGKPIVARLPADISGAQPFKTGTAAPTTTDYPNDGDNGQFYDTALSQLYIVRNYLGTLIYPNFVSISGTISATQHGDLSGAGATNMHAFTQVTGTITAAQHGNLTGGALHAAVTGAANGFMIAADKTKLDNATDAATASRLVIRDANADASFRIVNATTQYNVNGTQVLISRRTGWSNWTGTASRASHASYTDPGASAGYVQAEMQGVMAALQDVSQAMRAIVADLHATAGMGIIGA